MVLPSEAEVVLAKSADKRSPQEQTMLRELFRSKIYQAGDKQAATYAAVVKKIDALEADRKKLRDATNRIKVMVMDTVDQPRETRILEKGLYNKTLGDPIKPDVPSVLPPLPEDSKRDRLALARWLVSPEHPLTARVTVNRYWQTFFGQGIVQTPEDFGSQGKPPTHPKLLDWLAVEFVESGWDVKALHRLIVTSQTYRQSFAHHAAASRSRPC